MKGRKRWLCRWALLAVTLLIFCAATAGEMATAEEPELTAPSYPYDTVTRDTVNLRATRSVRGTLLKRIPKGAEITVHAVSGTWAEVTYGKYTGYAKKEYIVLKTIVKVKLTPTPTPIPTLSPEEDAGGYEVLRKGDSGAAVRALQQALIEMGYLSGTADGQFGAATENAVIQFQQVNEYPVTGIVDANLQAFLYSGKPKNTEGKAAKINTLSPVSGVTMRKGSIGDAVMVLQNRLKELGYYQGEIGNTYDSATVSAVKAFQKKNGLTADGIAGKATQDALYAAGALRADETPTPEPTATATPAPTYAVPSATVKLHSEGDEVKTVQRRLKELGYYRGNIDGKFGYASVAALRKFQRAHGLEDDGIAGKSTYDVLFSDQAMTYGETPTPTPEPTPAPSEVPTISAATPSTLGTLRPGDGGDNVALLQEALIALDYLEGPADGNYGDKTKTAVRAFQKTNGLTVDGVAGEETLNLLMSGKAKAAATPAPTETPSPTPKATEKATEKTTEKATATPAPSSGVLQQGDRGDAVRALQNRLIELGYLTGKADGVYGAQTYQAVLAFQQANKLSADGIAGSKTQSRMNSNSAVAVATEKATGSASATPAPTSAPVTVRPVASQVLYANWYTTVKAKAKKYPYCTLYEPGSGISWQIHIFSLGAHADYEPLTANDTSKLEKVFGGNTWNPKAVWVVFADGTVYLASTHSNPHDVQHITDNNFPGHSCLHFPRTQEQVEAIGPYATSHQQTIDAAWAQIR